MKEKTKGRVLLVDGNAGIARFLKINLSHAGYEVIEVHDVKKAEEVAASESVDVVAMESSASVETLEAVPRLRHILGCPFLIYGLGDFTEVEKARLKADGYIDRFYEPAEFVRAIETVMSQRTPCKN